MIDFEPNFNPPHDYFDLDELGIVRRNISTFERLFTNWTPNPDVDYVYHVQNVLTDYGELPILSTGIVYAKSLHKAGTLSRIKFHEKGRTEQYLESLRAHYCRILESGGAPYATYYFAGLDGACLSQAQTLRNSLSTFNEYGRITKQANQGETLRSLPLITRIRTENLPEGMFFPDPLTFDSPKSVLHLVAERGNRIVISPEFIEVSIGDQFHPAVEIELSHIKSMIDCFDIKPLIQRILPAGG